MKTITLFILTVIASSSLFSQSFLTRGEVFDFEVNDEFHYTRHSQPGSNAQRYTITGKYYASNQDTVYYVRAHDNYGITIDNSNTVTYNFTDNIDTIYYTNLTLPIYTFGQWVENDTSFVSYDSINGVDTTLCNVDINGFEILTTPFEPLHIIRKFGRGLGITKDYLYDPSALNNQIALINQELIYYKKNGIACGTPDLASVSIHENKGSNNFKVYPNPVQDILHIDNTTTISEIEIFNATGQKVKHLKIDNTIVTIDLSDFPKGIYTISLKSEYSQERRKVVKI